MGAADVLIRLGAVAALLALAWGAWSRARTMPGERRRILGVMGVVLLAVILLGGGNALVTEHAPYSSGHELGVWLAWAGLLLILLLFLYALVGIVAALVARLRRR